MASECGSCKAPIRWALTPAGEKAPLDAEPNREKGNVLLLMPTILQAAGGYEGSAVLLAVTLSGETLALARRRPEKLYLNHWATCPDRAEWREKTDAKRAQA